MSDQQFMGTFASSSSDAKYDVQVDLGSRKLWCNCPGWRNKRVAKNYECKHTKAVLVKLLEQGWTSQVQDEAVYVYANGDAPTPVIIEEAPVVAAPKKAVMSLEDLKAQMATKAGKR